MPTLLPFGEGCMSGEKWSCCGEADAYWADEIHVRDGKTFATITDDRPDEPRAPASPRHRNGNRNPEQQTQIPVTASSSWAVRIRIVLRSTRRRLID
jgi:hypothetical protein